MDHSIRAVRAGEWEKAREIRLAALRDPAAPIAFLDTYEQAVGRPAGYWQDRTDTAASGVGFRQFVAEDSAGRWVGTVTVMVEGPSDDVRFGEAAKVDQTHLVGVFVRPEVRGTGVTEGLFQAAVAWSWALREPPVERIRLYAHERNSRAIAFYRRFGFVPSGDSVPVLSDPSAREFEYELRRS
ncbi:GNAT family N-acetyltransferase [Streptomyces spongiicola]|uniref:GNAT family N-acetyltransferase n=1 Tax=Streptomyces spongiicola TaxID=1690221 RepID=A0A388T8M2_9ACTN|nr:GNAT family N-acetyltransferase [Streptomyces spongiicola]GBQ03875.1 GNAT family N-acetyltransferase [Streptomyces spongiicola]